MTDQYFRNEPALRKAICILIREYGDSEGVESDDEAIDKAINNGDLGMFESIAKEILEK